MTDASASSTCAYVRSVGPGECGGGADRLGAEARPRAEARCGVERDADGGDVDAAKVDRVREPHERADAGEAGEDLRVDRPRPLRSFHEANDNPSLWNRLTS